MKVIKPTVFILDVDGVFTDGSFYYTPKGKIMKKFGPDDNDALDLLSKWIHIEAVSGDKRGFQISKKRIEDDMGLQLTQVSTFERVEWIKKKFNLEEVIYMGDGIFDPLVFKRVAYSIAPANAFYTAKSFANFVTLSKGGSGAVAEAALHIMDKFFEPFNYDDLNFSGGSGAWK